MTLEQARFVVEVASCGKLREAANNLYVSPSAVSQSISALENELGFQIFTRSRTGSALTAAGTSVYALCIKITQGMDEMRHLARTNLGRESANIIRIGLCNFAPVIHPIIVEHARSYHISVHHCAITDMEYLINNGFLDIAFCSSVRPTYLRHKQDYHTQLVNHTDLLLSMRPEHPLASLDGPVMPPEALTNARWCFLNPDLDRLLAACIPNYQIHNMVYVSNHMDDVIEILRQYDYCALLAPERIPKDFVTYNLYIAETRLPRLYNYVLYGKGLDDNNLEKNTRILDLAESIQVALRSGALSPE